MDITCFRCEGKGVLPQFSHIKGGVCFTCNGTGTAKTFSTYTLNRRDGVDAIRGYVSHSSNRDIATIFKSGEFTKLKPEQQTEARKELYSRAKNYYGINPDNHKTSSDVAVAVLKELDKREKDMPKTHEKSSYYKAGKVSLVPVHWLKKLQGNNLRRSEEGMKEFSQELLRDGLKEEIYITIGQEDRNVSVGEGNHRMNAFIQAGLDHIPARVVRSTNNTWGTAQYYDRMSRVPRDDYFKADASPDEVFDTYYDHDILPALNSDGMKSQGYDKANVGNISGTKVNGIEVKELYVKDSSKALEEQLQENIQYLYSKGGTIEDVKEAIEKVSDVKSKKDGIAVTTMGELLSEIDEAILPYITVGVPTESKPNKKFDDLMDKIMSGEVELDEDEDINEYMDLM